MSGLFGGRLEVMMRRLLHRLVPLEEVLLLALTHELQEPAAAILEKQIGLINFVSVR